MTLERLGSPVEQLVRLLLARQLRPFIQQLDEGEYQPGPTPTTLRDPGEGELGQLCQLVLVPTCFERSCDH